MRKRKAMKVERGTMEYVGEQGRKQLRLFPNLFHSLYNMQNVFGSLKL
jgi:hypothetical protein